MPHREKKRKVVQEVDETPVDQSRVSHILERFHKLKPVERVIEKVEEEVVEEHDLSAIPQPEQTRIKRHVDPSAGLADYLKNPEIISTTLRVPFADLPLCERLQKNVAKHFTDAFAVQAAILPVLLESHLPEDRRDILVSAPTGSGKTLAYVLPILQALHTRKCIRLRALVVVPTRELVLQVKSVFEQMSSKLGLKIEILTSTRAMAAEQELLKVDILICTPGRLVDHINGTPGFSLEFLRFLVIDEGDRLLNQSFQNWSEHIPTLKPNDKIIVQSMERCQKLVFSATMTTDPGMLAQLKLIAPVLYLITDGEDVTKFTAPALLKEYTVHSAKKLHALIQIIKHFCINKAIIFTGSNDAARKLTTFLTKLNYDAVPFTSELTPQLRRRYLQTTGYLVCSELMARGVDIATEFVINYDSSITTRQYIHRVGRTARAGQPGIAISIVEKHERAFFWRQIGKIIRSQAIQKIELDEPTDEVDALIEKNNER